jgi:hypothetical protein
MVSWIRDNGAGNDRWGAGLPSAFQPREAADAEGYVRGRNELPLTSRSLSQSNN